MKIYIILTRGKRGLKRPNRDFLASTLLLARENPRD